MQGTLGETGRTCRGHKGLCSPLKTCASTAAASHQNNTAYPKRPQSRDTQSRCCWTGNPIAGRTEALQRHKNQGSTLLEASGDPSIAWCRGLWQTRHRKNASLRPWVLCETQTSRRRDNAMNDRLWLLAVPLMGRIASLLGGLLRCQC